MCICIFNKNYYHNNIIKICVSISQKIERTGGHNNKIWMNLDMIDSTIEIKTDQNRSVADGEGGHQLKLGNSWQWRLLNLQKYNKKHWWGLTEWQIKPYLILKCLNMLLILLKPLKIQARIEYCIWFLVIALFWCSMYTYRQGRSFWLSPP